MKKTRNLFNTQKQVVMSRSEKNDYVVFMEVIDEETEQKLDKAMNIHGSFNFINIQGKRIPSSFVYLYGSVDLNNKKDIKYLERYNKAILNPFDVGNWYYTSFNYETGEITYDESNGRWAGINFIADFLKWFKFKYCILGKPKNIIIYKYPLIRKND